MPTPIEPDIGARLDEEEGARLHVGAKSDDDSDNAAALSNEQVAERAFKSTKDRIFMLLCLSALVDTMGASLLSPAYAMAVSRAAGAVPPESGIHQDAFPDVPLSFSLAVNSISSAMVLGGVFSSLSMGPLSDRLGRKPLIITGLLGGAFGYLLMYIAGAVFNSYIFFVAAMFINGLFSGTKSVMMSYFADVYTPEEFGSKQPLFGMFVLTGGTAGGLFGGIIIGASGHLWSAAWLGVIASVAFAGAIFLVMPEDSKHKHKQEAVSHKKTDAPQPDDDGGATVAPPPGEDVKQLSATTRKILLICICSGAIDSLGDEGNRFARSTIMPQTYPITKDPSIMSLIGSSNILATAFCMALVMGSQKKTGLAVFTVFGNGASTIVQYLLMVVVRAGDGPWQLGVFFAIWWLGQLFGFTSSMAQMILVGQTAPKESRGFWTGMSGAAGNFVKFAGPLALSVCYGSDNKATLVLGVCGSISLVATLTYLPLLSLMPPPAKKDLKLRSMEAYEAMSHVEFMQLPLQERWELNKERKKAQKPPIMHGWGLYDEQLPHLAGLIERSRDDFAFLKSILVEQITHREQLEAFRMGVNAFRAERSKDPSHAQSHREEMEAMGRWLGAYWDDAGYEGWKFYPELFKAMVMTAFPPIEALDSKSKHTLTQTLGRPHTLNPVPR